MAKFTYIGFSIPTSNVNHTGLYKYAQELPGFKSSTFEAMYKTAPSRFKSVSSREHDEVISRSLEVMGLNKQWIVDKDERYVNVYGKIRTGDVEAEEQLVGKLHIFIKKFQRKPGPIELTRFTDPNDSKKVL